MDFHLDRADKKLKDQRAAREAKRKAEAAKRKATAAKAAKATEQMEARLAAARQKKQEEAEAEERRRMEEELLTGGIEYGEVLKATPIVASDGPLSPGSQRSAGVDGASDKVVLPQSALETLTARGVFDQSGAMFFELTSREGGRTHCGLDSFTPVSLVEVAVVSTDKRAHQVAIFFELTGQIAVDQDSSNVSWARDSPSPAMPPGAVGMRIFRSEQSPLHHAATCDGIAWCQDPKDWPTQHIDWGAAHLTLLPSSGGSLSSWMGSSNLARASFARSGALPVRDETAMPLPACQAGNCSCSLGGTGVDNDWPSLAGSWELGTVGASAQTARAVMSYDDGGNSGRYFGEVLPEYWRRDGLSFGSMLGNVTSNFDRTLQRCSAYDDEMVTEMLEAGGQDFATVGALSHRQVLGDNSLLWSSVHRMPMMLVKGLNSSGDTGTIDDNFPASGFFLWRQPSLINAILNPVNLFMSNATLCTTCGASALLVSLRLT